MAGFDGILMALAWTLCQPSGLSKPLRQTAVLVATIENVREEPSSLYCECNNIQGRDLVFDLVVKNRTEVPRTVYAFIWASNDKINPPERGLWPVSAVETCLTETGELDITNPQQGHPVKLAPGGVVRLKGTSMLQPIGWYEGELARFQRLRVEIWSAEGRRLLRQDRKLDPRRWKKSRPPTVQ